jgi:small conductance mechanosensitive channel
MFLLLSEERAMRVGRLSTWIVLITSAVIIMSGYNSLVMAQKDSNADNNNAGLTKLSSEMSDEEATKLLSRINSTIKSILRYGREMEKADQEDRLVLQLQIYQQQKQIMGDIHQLADALLEIEKKGSQPKLREKVEDVFTRVTPRLWYHINRIGKEIDTIRARRTKAKAEEAFAIENEVTRYARRLDTFYELSFAHIKKMEQLGMDIVNERETFIQLLYDRSDKLSGRLSLALTRIGDLEEQLKKHPDETTIAKSLTAAQKSLSTNTVSLEVVLDLMDAFELDTAMPRAQLVSVTRDISSRLLNIDVAFGLVSRSLKKIANWFVENGSGYLVKLLILVGILFVFRFAIRFVRAGLEKALDASNLNLSRLARRMLISTTSNLIMLFGILVALSQVGISLGPLLAGLGVAGFIIGFALQDTLGNFASGVMILLYRPYDVGDLVDVGGVEGRVHKMNLVSTSLLTLDNQLYVVPNTKIWGDVIKNVTDQKTRRVDMVFGISYGDDIPKAESILEDILKLHEKVLDEPEPMVRLHTLGASSVDFVVRPWVKVDDYWDVYWAVTRTVKMRFDEAGVSIPFPQRDVHIYNEDNHAPSIV